MPSYSIPSLPRRPGGLVVAHALSVAHQALNGALAALADDPAYGSAHRQALILARGLVEAVFPESEEARRDG